MSEPSEWVVPPASPGVSGGESASPLALWIALAGHAAVLLAAAVAAGPPSAASVAAIACSIVAIAALAEPSRPDVRARRAVTATACGHGVAAAVIAAGLAPGVPRWIAVTGLAAAVALGVASLATVGRATKGARKSRPLALAPRVAAVALVAQALLQQWAASGSVVSMPQRAALFSASAALGVAVLASLSSIVLRLRLRWALAGLLAWTVGWVASTADLGALILWSLGAPFPVGPHQLRLFDTELVQVIATMGGLAIGASLASAIRDVRVRHSAVVLLVGYAVFGVIIAVAEHRIALATDFPEVAALRTNRELADVVRAFALAGVLWQYWRRVSRRVASA